jgi:hypothetical protein
MGFRRAIVPAGSAGLDGIGVQASRGPRAGDEPSQPIQVIEVEDIRQALSAVLGSEP